MSATGNKETLSELVSDVRFGAVSRRGTLKFRNSGQRSRGDARHNEFNIKPTMIIHGGHRESNASLVLRIESKRTRKMAAAFRMGPNGAGWSRMALTAHALL